MTELAKEKIREAEFFLEQMESSTDLDAFRYYLSAVLSATWSVFDLLWKEWGEYEEFAAWHKKREHMIRNDQFYNFMINARNCVTHYGHLEPDTRFEILNKRSNGIDIQNQAERPEFIEFSHDDGESYTVKLSGGSSASISFPSGPEEASDVEIDAPKYFSGSAVEAPLPDNYSGVSVTYMCEEFLEEMRSLVEVAEAKFDFIPAE